MAKTQYTLDTDLQVEDGAAAITADGAGSAIIDLGSTTATVRGDAVLDVSAIDHTSDDEQHLVCVQGSSSATFASTVDNLAILDLSAAGVAYGGADVDPSATRYILPFTNEKGGTVYRYLRIYVDVAGTTPSVTFTGYLCMPKDD